MGTLARYALNFAILILTQHKVIQIKIGILEKSSLIQIAYFTQTSHESSYFR